MRKEKNELVREIVGRFGGPSALAREIGRTQSAVSNWIAEGAIPDSWHLRLLRLAKEKALPLTEDELLSATNRK